MSEPRPITIVGGGLAGLTLGIGLRQQGIPATVVEAGHYPRHRVCGEFISGRGVEMLERLGLREALGHAGAVAARTAAFFSGPAQSPVRQMRTPALCLSRFLLDELLAREFQRLGGELRLHERWREEFGEAVVRASGRRPQAVENGWRWFGVKAHARNVALGADLEMHASPGGYVGLCRLSGGEVNVCGLFRRRPVAPAPALDELGWLRGSPGNVLHERLATAEFDAGSICAVAGLSLAPRRAAARTECCIGDALTMIPPVTGNGMSMAFESATMAIMPLAAYSGGRLTWMQAQQSLARACDTRFARRLAWARFLQWFMFASALQCRLGSLALRSDWLWRAIFRNTR
jgi:2-polyprenyl-6-methoxyphenol hydroxylase-like FAD-dependent oxidoreductase